MSELNPHPTQSCVLRNATPTVLTTARRLFRAAGYTMCALVLQARPAFAENEPSACTKGRATAASEIACELAQQIDMQQSTLVVSAPPEADAELAEHSRFAGLLSGLVAAHLGQHATGHPREATLGAAQMVAAKHEALLFLEPRIQQGKLRISANLYPIARSFWDRVRDPRPGATGHGYSERPLDAELRSFFAPIPLVAKSTTLAVPPERAPVALACGDADQDGSMEVAFVGRRRIALGRFRNGRFVSSAAKSWAELSPIATTPLKAPVASVHFRADSSLDVGSSDRARFVRLDARLEPLETAPRRIPFGPGCLDLDGHRLGNEPVRCLPKDLALEPATLEHLTNHRVSEAFLNEQGKLTTYVASYLADEDAIVVTSGTEQLDRLDNAGSQLALADLNADGRPELLSSASTLDRTKDMLLVHSLNPKGRLSERLRISVPDGITAIAACSVPTASMAPIVVGTLSRLWVIQ